MSPGRTSWWPCDAAEHDRELNVELGEEFGPSGPLVMRVLKDLAQQQRDDGRVRTGFRVLRSKTFVQETKTVRAIVEHAAAIGALDDLQIDPDGRRFICRISGWMADQTRGKEAIRKAAFRAEQDEDTSPPNGTTGSRVPSGRDVSGSVPLNREEKRRNTPPTPPQGGRDRDRAIYERDFASWAATHFPDVEVHLVKQAADRLRFARAECTVETVGPLVEQLHARFSAETSEEAAA